MTSAHCLVTTFVCLLTYSTAQEAELTPKVKDFLSVFNGYFTNRDQILEEKSSLSSFIHPFSGALFIPYKVPALPKSPTVFIEQRFEDFVFRRAIGSVSNDDQGRILVELYDLPIAENDKPGSYSIQQLDNLKPEDLNSRPECTVVFTEVSESYFNGFWPDCSQDFGEEQPYYNITVSCRLLIVATHQAARESPGAAPFVQRLETVKFPSVYYDSSDDKCSQEN